ncbi:MAG: glycosyltransferase family 4 protein [Acidobacteriia bacterium]|nr:glycosyltransferase family 4 protein [Terriglobia bacterium]
MDPGRRLRVAIDARALAERPCGFRRYLEGLLPALRKADASLETVLLTTRSAPRPRGLGASFPVVRLAGSRFTLLRPWWEIRSLPRALARSEIDVFFSTTGALPMTSPTPAVVMIHDLAILRVPGIQPWYYSWYWRTVYRRCRRANEILVPSLSTRRDVIELLDIDPSRVRVVPCAAGERFRPSPPEAIARVLTAWGIDGDYVLAVGTREPRKNLGTLVAAMARVNRDRRRAVKLVVAGGPGWGPQAFLRGCPDWVRVLGLVSDDDLVALYGGAAAFAFPSLYEGFGLPVAEAMRCGAPVVASATSSIPELVGDAAVLVQPTDVAGWAGALGELLCDPTRRLELSRSARRRGEAFSWDVTAQGVAAALRAAVATSRVAAPGGVRRPRAGRATAAGVVAAPPDPPGGG